MMKLIDSIPRHAFVVFFWCALIPAILSLASIAVFFIFMPDNEHGRQGIFTAVRSFGPGLLISTVLAGLSLRAIRSRNSE